MLRTATAGLQGYCPVCLLPCITTEHAACREHVLPAHSRAKANLQNKWHCHECNGIPEQSSGRHSLTSRPQQQHGAQLLKAQQHGAQLLKAEQSVGVQERWPLVGANGAADNTVSGHTKAAIIDCGLSAQGGEAAKFAQKQQQLQEHKRTSISDAEAAEAGKEASEAWVTYLLIASCTLYCLYCMW